MKSNESGFVNNVTVDHFGPIQTGIFGTWLVIIMIASIIGNLLVMIVILRNKRMRAAKNGTNLFLFNLAISDLMVGICMVPFSLNTLIHEEWQFPQWLCSMNSFLNTLFLVTSIHTLMYISIHKFVSLRRHANGDQRHISRKTCLILISAAWLWGILFGLMTIVGLSRAVYRPKKLQCGPMYPKLILKDASLFICNFIINLVLPIVIMGITYRKIFHILHQSSLFRIRSASCARPNNQEEGATKTLLLVLGIFILCWFPYVIYIFYALVLEDKNDIPSYLNPLAYCSGFTNSICNPVIYAFRFKDFRKGYEDIFRKSSYLAARASGIAGCGPRHSRTSESSNIIVFRNKRPSEPTLSGGSNITGCGNKRPSEPSLSNGSKD